MHTRGWQERFLIFWPSSSWASWCQAERCTAAHPEIFWDRNPWLVDVPNTVTKSQNTAWLVQPYRNKGKASGTSKAHSFFFPSVIALQLNLNCRSCSWDCKTTQAGEGKWNPILTYRRAHNKHGGCRFSALKLQPWKTDNKAGIARILRAFSRHLHGFKEDTICAIRQSTTRLEACREFWRDQLWVYLRVAHLRKASPRE